VDGCGAEFVHFEALGGFGTGKGPEIAKRKVVGAVGVRERDGWEIWLCVLFFQADYTSSISSSSSSSSPSPSLS